MRTPLNAILGVVQVLRVAQLNPHQESNAIRAIERNAKTLARIVEDLLDLSRMNGGRLRVDVTPVDLAAIIPTAIDDVRLAAGSLDVDVIFTSSAESRLVMGDAIRLGQVVGNLLTNAVKFTPAGERIEVRLAFPGSHAEIQVRDTGQGMSAEFLSHVFEPFTQAAIPRARGLLGMGLGLAIVKCIVELHGGTVQAASPGLGQGATFTVSIPAVAAVPLDAAGGRSVTDAAVAEAPRLTPT